MTAKWYEHVLDKNVETDQVKILWDFNIQTNHVLEHRRLDVEVLDKTKKMCHLIDIAVPGDIRVVRRRQKRSKSTKTWPGNFVRFGR